MAFPCYCLCSALVPGHGGGLRIRGLLPNLRKKTSANFHHSASVSGCSGTRLQLEQRLPKLAALLQRLQSWGGRQTTLPLLADTWDGLPSRGPTPAPSHDG